MNKKILAVVMAACFVITCNACAKGGSTHHISSHSTHSHTVTSTPKHRPPVNNVTGTKAHETDSSTSSGLSLMEIEALSNLNRSHNDDEHNDDKQIKILIPLALIVVFAIVLIILI